LLALGGLSLAACASSNAPPVAYKLYPGPVRPAAELAELKPGVNFALAVDGLKVNQGEWDEVLLLPGRHQIDCVAEYGASVMVEPSGFGHAGTHLEVDLAAGHAYAFHYARTYGQGYRVWLWIEDGADGSVVAGAKKP